jgi:hypothetical protein
MSYLKDQGDRNFRLCMRMEVRSSHFTGETATVYLLNTALGISQAW